MIDIDNEYAIFGRQIAEDILMYIMIQRSAFLALFLCSVISCTSKSEFEQIPPIDEWVRNIRTEILREKGTEGLQIGKLVMGEVDTLHIVTQTLYERQPKLEQELLDSLRNNLKSLVPELVLVEGIIETEASLLLQIWTDKTDHNIVYGYLSLSFTRNVKITATNYERSAEVWDDVIPFAEKGNPEKRIWWALRLQATKFAAMWILSNR